MNVRVCLAVIVPLLIVMSSVGVDSTYLNIFSDGNSEKELAYPPNGGYNRGASIKLPKLAMVRKASLTIDSDKLTDSGSVSYSTKREFKKGVKDDNIVILDDDAGITLLQRNGVLKEKFTDYKFIDNSSTDVQIDMYGVVRLGSDPTTTQSYSGRPSASQGTRSDTYDYGGRLFKYARVYNLYSSYRWVTLTLKVDGYNPKTGQWTNLCNKRGSYGNWPSYTATFNPPIYSKIRVVLSSSYAWSRVTYSYDFQVCGYKNTGKITSKEFDGVDWNMYKATLTADYKTPSGTSVKFYLSADNGTHWEGVEPGKMHTFTNTGNQLRWRAELSTTSHTTTPEIYQVNVSFMKKVEDKGVFMCPEIETDWSVISAKATWIADIKAGTNISVEFTNDGGTTWKEGKNGKDVEFPYELGKKLFRFRVILTSDGENKPVLKSISVTYNTAIYPRNVTVDIGDNGKIEWHYEGNLLTEQKIDSDDFVSELNSILPHIGEGDLEIPINISVKVGGKIILKNLSIEYGLPPVLSKEIPNIEMKEDDKLKHAIDLEKYFTDDYDDGKLTFEIWFQQDPTKVEATIEGKYLNLQTKTPNWTGEVSFSVRASDTEGLRTQSNIFKVIVKNEPDPPIIEPIGTVYANEDQEFIMEIKVIDGDREDAFTFSDNTDMFDISPHGKIKFTPLQKDVGEHKIKITVRDKDGLEDTKEMTLIINNTNDPPRIKEIGPQKCEEDKEFILLIEVEDDDLPDYDKISFDLKNPIGNMKIDASGKLTWTPTNDDVGDHYVIVVATDSKGLVSERKIKITVVNVNDPPIVKIIEPRDGSNFTEKDIIKFKCEASDVDKGDNLEITWYDGDKKLDIGASFEATLSPGMHNIRVVVSDGKDKSESTVRINVKKVVGSEPVDGDGAGEEDAGGENEVFTIMNMNAYLFLGLLGACVCAMITAISYVVYRRSKRKREEELRRREEEEKRKKEELSSFGGYATEDFDFTSSPEVGISQYPQQPQPYDLPQQQQYQYESQGAYGYGQLDSSQPPQTPTPTDAPTEPYGYDNIPPPPPLPPDDKKSSWEGNTQK